MEFLAKNSFSFFTDTYIVWRNKLEIIIILGAIGNIFSTGYVISDLKYKNIERGIIKECNYGFIEGDKSFNIVTTNHIIQIFLPLKVEIVERTKGK